LGGKLNALYHGSLSGIGQLNNSFNLMCLLSYLVPARY
jgi:hypothetical protein